MHRFGRWRDGVSSSGLGWCAYHFQTTSKVRIVQHEKNCFFEKKKKKRNERIIDFFYVVVFYYKILYWSIFFFCKSEECKYIHSKYVVYLLDEMSDNKQWTHDNNSKSSVSVHTSNHSEITQRLLDHIIKSQQFLWKHITCINVTLYLHFYEP